jgi:hypothetical protein
MKGAEQKPHAYQGQQLTQGLPSEEGDAKEAAFISGSICSYCSLCSNGGTARLTRSSGKTRGNKLSSTVPNLQSQNNGKKSCEIQDEIKTNKVTIHALKQRGCCRTAQGS